MMKLSAATAHFGDPCTYCGVPHDDVPPGPCIGRTNDRIAYRRSLGLPNLGLDEKETCPRCGEDYERGCLPDGCRDPNCPLLYGTKQ